jgi:hypothetical protein
MQTSGKKSRTRPKTTAPDDPEQSARFIEAAREAQADETEEGADRAFRTAVGKLTPKKLIKP